MKRIFRNQKIVFEKGIKSLQEILFSYSNILINKTSENIFGGSKVKTFVINRCILALTNCEYNAVIVADEKCREKIYQFGHDCDVLQMIM